MRRVDSAGVAMAPLWQAAEAPLPLVDTDARDSAACRLEAEITAARKTGHQEGYAEGLKQANEDVEREHQAWLSKHQKEFDTQKRQLDVTQAKLKELVESVPGEVERQAIQAEETAVAVAYAAVVKLLGDGYRDGDLMRALVRTATTEAGHAVESIRVAEADVDLLQGLESIPVIGDRKLSPGQCVLETRCGHQETGLDARLESLKQALLAGLAQHREAGVVR